MPSSKVQVELEWDGREMKWKLLPNQPAQARDDIKRMIVELFHKSRFDLPGAGAIDAIPLPDPTCPPDDQDCQDNPPDPEPLMCVCKIAVRTRTQGWSIWQPDSSAPGSQGGSTG